MVANIRQIGFSPETVPVIYLHYQWNIRHGMTLVVRSHTAEQALIAALQEQIRQIEPDQPISQIHPMQELLRDSLARPRATMVLLGLLAGLALLLAAVGVYGTLLVLTGSRIHEIGVRISLGARAWDVLKLVAGQGMLSALLGVVAGLLAAAALTQFMASLLFEVSARDPAIYATVALLLLMVAGAACYLPARQASKVDPIRALHWE